MDENSGYCGCGNEIESVWDAAKIANMVIAGPGEELTRPFITCYEYAGKLKSH